MACELANFHTFLTLYKVVQVVQGCTRQEKQPVIILMKIWYFGKVPNVSHLCVFGCKGYMHVPADKHRKLDAKAIEVVLVSYE